MICWKLLKVPHILFCEGFPKVSVERHYTDYSLEILKEIYEKADLKVLVWLHIFLIVQDVGKVIEEWENTGWCLHTYSCAGNAALALGISNRVFSYFSLLIWCIRLLIVSSSYILITFCYYFGRENYTLSLFCRH